MRRKLAITYAIICMLALIAGFALVFFFAWKIGIGAMIACICGILLGFIFAPTVHELGHICRGKAQNMQCVYWKCFCLRRVVYNGKKRVSFCSPFAPDETQMLPKSGGNMQNRAAKYTLGGLVFSGVFLCAVVAIGIVFSLLDEPNFVVWGMLPYTGYLFLVNALPLEYASGKTDALVYRGIKKGYDAEKCMLSAMEIQGQLFAGKSFGEIDKALYFDLPQLCEDEPLFMILLDLRYRYFLDKGDFDGAADCLNRLIRSENYLSDGEVERVAAELTYMHAVGGDLARAEESGKLCQDFLRGESVTAKRILAAYAHATGKIEEKDALLAQARAALPLEPILGVRKLEENLLSRIEKQ